MPRGRGTGYQPVSLGLPLPSVGLKRPQEYIRGSPDPETQEKAISPFPEPLPKWTRVCTRESTGKTYTNPRTVPGGDHGGYPQRAIPDAGVSLHRGGRVGRIEQKPDASPIRVGTVGVREANPWLYEDCLNTIWNEPTHGATCERVRCTARRPNKEEL